MLVGKETTLIGVDMADKGTNNDLAPVRNVTDEEAAKFELDPHLIKLMWDEPFFAKIIRTVTKVKTDKIPTAGVLAKDGDIKMWWNPKFLAGLTADQVKGLLKHECYHLVFEHTTTRRMTPHIIHNYATDLAINSMIPEDELPEGGLIPGKAFKELTAEDKEKMGPEAVARYERVSAKIESFEKGWASEVYFAKLMEDPEIAEDIQEGNKGQKGEPGDGDGPGMPGGMDDHDGWDEMSDEERELVKGKVKQALEDAVKECDASGQWGSVSGQMRATLREMVANDINWKAVLKNFCGMLRRSNRQANVRRINRKYTGIHPGMQKGYTSSIAVYIDQSGSVDNASLEMLFANLRSLAKQTEFVVYHFDTEVDESSETVWRKGKTPPAHRTRYGGTCFKAPTKHANKNKHRFDGYLILTDGEAYDPGPSKVKRGWVIIPGRELMFTPAKRDVVIKMKDEKKAA
jgi:predicted metal-dependent peptidase